MPEFKQRNLMFRAWSTKFNKFLVTGFHIIGETTLFDMLNQHRIEELDTLLIQQYTGMVDKNGTHIYEGDMVKHINGTITEVQWITCEEDYDFDGWLIRGDEIVGNVFEGIKS